MIKNRFQSIFLVLLISIFLNSFSYSQESTSEPSTEKYDEQSEILKSAYGPRFGIFANYGLNFHHTNFRELPQYPNCCNLFENGYGTGLNYGALVQLRAKDNWYYGAKLSFENISGLIEKEYYETFIIKGNLVKGKIYNALDVAYNNIVLQPFISYSNPAILDRLYFSLGAKLGINVSANFSQYEQLLSPEVGTFENGYRIRNNKNGDLPDKNPLLLAGNIGIYYELPLNNANNLKIVPEINYNYWINSPVKNLTWNISQLTFGLGVRYNTPPKPEPPPVEPILPVLPDLELPQIITDFILDVNHKIYAIDEETGNSSDNEVPNLTIEDFTHTNLKPLLNYIFFDENSIEIPNRYKTISSNQTNNFDYKQFQSLNALETYYHCLNIIGYRLKQFPNTTVELTGTNSNRNLEKNNITLSQARANSVKNYLTDIWGIAPERIKVIARNLPKDPTKPTEECGDEENRRVEIYSSDNRIMEPIFSLDTVSVVKNKKIEFLPKCESSFGINTWNLELRNNDSVIQRWGGNNILPREIEWEITSQSLANDIKNKATYQLTVSNKIGNTKQTTVKNLPINRITVASKRSEQQSIDKEYEYYSLILFDFASRNLDDKHNRVIDFIKSRVKSNSIVIISGYTDSIGQYEVNKKIAVERAKAAAKRLKFDNIEIRGVGKDDLLYDNTFPEGRFYCRTVTISIETPINAPSQ